VTFAAFFFFSVCLDAASSSLFNTVDMSNPYHIANTKTMVIPNKGVALPTIL